MYCKLLTQEKEQWTKWN